MFVFQAPKKFTSSGFSLIELITVIVLIGIVAAVALPRFSDITDSAELQSIESIAGAFRSGVEIVQTTFQSQGRSTRIQDLPNFGDNVIDTNDSGFPIGSDKGNANENIGRGNAGCANLWRALLTNPPSVSHNNNNADFRSFRHTGNRICSYVYRAGGDSANRVNAQIQIEYDSRDGSVRVCGQRSDIPSC